MKNELPYDALTKGYILIPKSLLEDLLEKEATGSLTDIEARLTLLANVNYKDCEADLGNGTAEICPRGDSLQSLLSWAARFGWTKGKTRRFFLRLQKEGMITLLPHPHTTHLRILDYDLWTGCRREARQRLQEKADEEFEEFWEAYHEKTHTRKVNRGKAEQEWRRLSEKEHKLATERIEDYYYSLRDINYCKQAATYLKDKSFLDEVI